MRPELARRVLVLALVCASVLVPRDGAHAGMGSLYTDLVCPVIGDLPGEFDFATRFVGLVNCDRLCLDAGFVCRRAVDDAASCQLAFVNDWIASDSRIDCNGLTGSLLGDCKAGWAVDKKFWQASVKQSRFVGRFGCANLIGKCATSCSGH